MIHGIYSAEFRSNQGLDGRGIVIVDKENKMHGGDADYIYRGKFRLDDSSGSTRISVTVDVSNYSGNPNSVFGQLKQYRVELTGVMTSTGFTLAGHVHNQPQMNASIVATKQADLIDE